MRLRFRPEFKRPGFTVQGKHKHQTASVGRAKTFEHEDVSNAERASLFTSRATSFKTCFWGHANIHAFSKEEVCFQG